jgi:[acyl-carrier-protein] S-malonyltransferase
MSKLAFLFPGQGSHELGMGRAFAEAYPEARVVYDVSRDRSRS